MLLVINMDIVDDETVEESYIHARSEFSGQCRSYLGADDALDVWNMKEDGDE